MRKASGPQFAVRNDPGSAAHHQVALRCAGKRVDNCVELTASIKQNVGFERATIYFYLWIGLCALETISRVSSIKSATVVIIRRERHLCLQSQREAPLQDFGLG
jgi:hypothetical protein